MRTPRATHIVLSIGAAALIAACSSEQTKPAAGMPAPVAHNPAPPVRQAPAPRAIQQPAVAANPLHDPNSILAKRSVYYDFDKYEVKPEFRPMVEAHAHYLLAHPGAAITVQGNTDERGSREYNIALGQRRAESVTKMMKLLGVPDKQMEAVSFGEEKPRAEGHDEAAWSQNRRSDIVYGREN